LRVKWLQIRHLETGITSWSTSVALRSDWQWTDSSY
jgi:hypothetical protein